MKKPLIIIFTVLIFNSNLFAQQDPLSSFSQNILKVVLSNDTTSLLKYTLCNKKIFDCVVEVEDSVIVSNINNVEDFRIEYISNLNKVNSKASLNGLNARNFKYLSSRIYPMHNDGSKSKIIAYKLIIKFISNDHSYELGIKELRYCSGNYFFTDNFSLDQID